MSLAGIRVVDHSSGVAGPYVALLVLHDPGGPVLEAGGEAALEHVRGLDQMVAHRDHRVPHRSRLGFGQKPIALLGLCGCRHRAPAW
jgi:hypothetical protein